MEEDEFDPVLLLTRLLGSHIRMPTNPKRAFYCSCTCGEWEGPVTRFNRHVAETAMQAGLLPTVIQYRSSADPEYLPSKDLDVARKRAYRDGGTALRRRMTEWEKVPDA